MPLEPPELAGRIVKTPVAAMGDQVYQLIMGHLPQFSCHELSQQGDAGGAKAVGEGPDPFPVIAFESTCPGGHHQA
jgi:hypothetical protein